MKNTTLCYIENERGEYLMLHRVKKQNDLNHDKWTAWAANSSGRKPGGLSSPACEGGDRA